MVFDLESLVRPNIRNLQPYRCARDDYSSGILLDANENAYGSCVIDPAYAMSLNRYPDPHQRELRARIAAWRQLPSEEFVFVGSGSDEAIDLLLRVFCEPGRDRILICPPTYGMYSVSAAINNLQVDCVPLIVDDFQLDVGKILETVKDEKNPVKMVFLCSPGNPTGKLLAMDDIKVIVSAASNSIIVVDEAYIDFASSSDCSAARLLADFDNVVVLQTLSKSFGLAGIRLGMALAKPQLIRYFYLVKPPYNISTLTSFVALQAFSNRSLSNMKSLVCNINTDKQRLAKSILDWPGVKSIRGGLDANFLLVELESNQQALAIYKALASSEKDRIVLRFRGNDLNCSGCIRITVGTTDEMELLEQRWNAAFDSLHDKQQQ